MLQDFFVSSPGSSVNLNVRDMELARKLALMDGYFTLTSKSLSADSWIHWQGLLLTINNC